jgi:hypothetical protein
VSLKRGMGYVLEVEGLQRSAASEGLGQRGGAGVADSVVATRWQWTREDADHDK